MRRARPATSAAVAEQLERAVERARELVSEQAALRQVASLVARESSPDQLFAVVTEQVARVFNVPHVRLARYEPDGSVVVGAFSEGVDEPFPIGSRWPLDNPGVTNTVRQTGRSARVEDYEQMPGEVAAVVRGAGLRSGVASPIVVERRLWGAMIVLSPKDEPFPEDTESRLTAFTELVATAIANAESRAALTRLADEQAALRRVATLVAEGVPSAALFAAVTTEVAHVFSDVDASLVATVIRFDPGPECVLVGASRAYEQEPLGARWTPRDLYVSTRVLRSGSSARVDEADLDAAGGPDADVLRLRGFLYQVGSPVVVEGQLWGAMTLNSRKQLPPDTDDRLESFTELVATAIANAASGEALSELAEEQAALRRVATLVARGAPSTEVFEAVATEVGKLLNADITVVGRYDRDDAATAIGSWSSAPGGVPVGTRSAIGGRNVLTLVAETGKPARMDGYDDASGEAAEIARRFGWRSSIAAPIVVEGRLWGVMLVATQRVEPFPAGAEERLALFTDLVATAVANTEARRALERVAAEQAGLRRVATLVAHGASPQDLFDAVAGEIGRLLPAANVSMGRYEPDDSVTSMASWSADGPIFAPGVRWPIKGTNVAWMVLQTGRQARIDDFSVATDPIGIAVREAGYKAAVGSPIVVDGHLWGVISAASTEGPMPPDSEARLASFTELVATALANANARAEVERLAEEQAALRRVATRVAAGVPPDEVFAAAVEEVGSLLPVGSAALGRYEPDGMVTTIAAWSATAVAFPPGRWWPTEGENVSGIVFRTVRRARMDDFSVASGPVGLKAREAGYRSAVGSPITVEGRLWGVMTAASNADEPLPPDTEERLERFTELVATAIANAESSAELAASRRRIVAASDDARRRIERDLHDGVQQQLVALALDLGVMKADPPSGDALKERLASVTEDMSSVLDALVETARGIHPAILSQGGLGAALKVLARRSAVPVELDTQIEGMLPDDVEVAAYYVVAEALTNVAKHARASVVHLEVATADGALRLVIRDDGVGGARPDVGSGLVGLKDRVEALGGTIKIESSAGTGTCVVATLPTATEPDRQIELTGARGT